MLKLINLLFSIGLFFSVATADYSISPVKLVITPESQVTSLEFRNDNDENKKFQVSILEVVRQNGKDVFKESKELNAVPVIFSLAPGKTQTIRVQSKNVEKMNGRNFKLAIKELFAKKATPGQSVVHMIPEFRIPVTSSTDKSQNPQQNEKDKEKTE